MLSPFLHEPHHYQTSLSQISVTLGTLGTYEMLEMFETLGTLETLATQHYLICFSEWSSLSIDCSSRWDLMSKRALAHCLLHYPVNHYHFQLTWTFFCHYCSHYYHCYLIVVDACSYSCSYSYYSIFYYCYFYSHLYVCHYGLNKIAVHCLMQQLIVIVMVLLFGTFVYSALLSVQYESFGMNVAIVVVIERSTWSLLMNLNHLDSYYSYLKYRYRLYLY